MISKGERVTMPIQAVEPRRLYRQIADQLRQLIDVGRVCCRRPAADRARTGRPAWHLPADRPRSADRAGGRGADTHPRRLRHLRHRTAALPKSIGVGDGRRSVRTVAGARIHRRGDRGRSRAPCDSRPISNAMDDVLGRMEDMRHPTKSTTRASTASSIRPWPAFSATPSWCASSANLFDQRMNPYFERLSSYFENTEFLADRRGGHRAVRDAIAARDPERAKAAMQEHLRLSQLRFSRNFGERSAAREVAE